jgi:hypothetical protein
LVANCQAEHFVERFVGHAISGVTIALRVPRAANAFDLAFCCSGFAVSAERIIHP